MTVLESIKLVPEDCEEKIMQVEISIVITLVQTESYLSIRFVLAFVEEDDQCLIIASRSTLLLPSYLCSSGNLIWTKIYERDSI